MESYELRIDQSTLSRAVVSMLLAAGSIGAAAMFAIKSHRLSRGGYMTDWLPLIWLAGAAVLLLAQCIVAVVVAVISRKIRGIRGLLVAAAVFGPLLTAASVVMTIVYEQQHPRHMIGL